ncbi:MAG: hypothetical protein ACRDXX_04845 [Stackebrandtia sp.]
MTRQKSFKRRVRERMDKTGESYTAARRQLVSDAEPAQPEPTLDAPAPAPAPEAPEPDVSDDAARKATGRGWREWFAILDDWGAAERGHTAVARWLVEEHSISGWWAQSVTVEYERARGLRVRGQTSSGDFQASASKTVDAPLERVSAAFTEDERRESWLPGDRFRVRTARTGKSLTADWDDGASRVGVFLTAKTEQRTQVSINHTKLPDADAVDELKALWRDALSDLKRLLEA